MKTIKTYLSIFCIALISLVSCKPNNSKEVELLKKGIHTVVVQEVLQTSEYTYFRLKELGNSKISENDTLWAATTKSESKAGETLYYKGGFPMKDFISKELKRTFSQVLFLDSLSRTTDFAKKEMANIPSHQYMSSSDPNVAGKPNIQKIEVKVDKTPGVTSIADLYGKKDSFSGKTVKVKGQVTKFSPEIMGKNWIHIQDGTETNGKFDLTITTDIKANVGDIITLEGKIALNKDLGYSYFYEVLMEDAKIVK